VGIDRARFRIPLGRWDASDPDPGGLLLSPVVVLPGAGPIELVTASAARSGNATVRVVSPEGAALLATASRADVLIVADGNGRTMNVIRALGGRPLPALPSPDPDAIRAFLDGCHVDLDVALPRTDGEDRDRLRATLAPLGLEEVHHLVEVDPRPGLEAAGIAASNASPTELWAAAAGVLAGRLAAGRRRWLADRS